MNEPKELLEEIKYLTGLIRDLQFFLHQEACGTWCMLTCTEAQKVLRGEHKKAVGTDEAQHRLYSKLSNGVPEDDGN